MGLQRAWDEGIRKLEVQTDSNTTLELIQTTTAQHPHYTIVSRIRSLVEKDWQVTTKHIFKEGNAVADFLTSLGHECELGKDVISHPCLKLNY
ncbi:unnamed protein product [Linum tenue]|uniref:RNase H type-1 domain-containing protein n=2 Tax=Linum tenue TaxID=586396 RepID=A0AAV0GZU9_9ROSI|nr:unnamed protein product [Linum tenue]